MEFVKVFIQNKVPSWSAELSYYLLFAFFPVLMVVFASLSLAGRDFNLFILSPGLKAILPDTVSEIINVFTQHLSSMQNNIYYLLFGIILTLYSVSRFTRSAILKIRHIYGVESKAKFISQWVTSFIFTLLLLLAFFTTLLLIVLGEYIIEFISYYYFVSDFLISLFLILRYVLTAGVILFIMALFYYYVPGIKQKPKHVVCGTLFTLSMWIVISAGFTFYVNNIARYSVIYGSIGTLIILLLWFYMTSMLIICGGIINSMIYKNTKISSSIKEV